MNRTRSCPHCGKGYPASGKGCPHCGLPPRNLDTTRRDVADAIHADALLERVGEFTWTSSHPRTEDGCDCDLCEARDGQVFTGDQLEALMGTRFCRHPYCRCHVRAVEL